jgi:hypothetical protein
MHGFVEALLVNQSHADSIRNNAVPICTDPRKCQVQFRVQTGMRLESDVHVIASNRVEHISSGS